MILTFIGLLLLVVRFHVLASGINWLSTKSSFDWDWLFYLTLSLDRNLQRIYLIHLTNRLIEGFIVLSLLSGIGSIMGFSSNWGVVIGLMIIIGLFGNMTRRIKRQQHVLLERLQRFLYFYEMSLMRGTHQYLALREADSRTGLFDHYETVSEYIEGANQLYSFVPWMVIKKMAILLERNQSFSNEDLTVDFIELSQEFHQRYAQMERLKLEQRENMMLLPMSLNMLLMILYLIAPFLGELF